MRTLFLGACGVILSVSVAQAQYSPRDESTPAELAQTQALNRQQVNEAGLPPAPPQRPSTLDPEAQARYRTALDEYNQRVRTYNREQLDAYNRRVQAYNDQRRAYERAEQNYREQSQAYAGDYPEGTDTYVIEPGPAVRYSDRMQLLTELNDPDRQIYNAPVADRYGYVIGHFRRLLREPDGDMAVITLSDNKTVSVPVERFFYDPQRDRVVTELDENEIARF
jgi:hypothetical protein